MALRTSIRAWRGEGGGSAEAPSCLKPRGLFTFSSELPLLQAPYSSPAVTSVTNPEVLPARVRCSCSQGRDPGTLLRPPAVSVSRLRPPAPWAPGSQVRDPRPRNTLAWESRCGCCAGDLTPTPPGPERRLRSKLVSARREGVPRAGEGESWRGRGGRAGKGAEDRVGRGRRRRLMGRRSISNESSFFSWSHSCGFSPQLPSAGEKTAGGF